MLGHSIGEYVAAHLSGVFSLEDALALVATRGRLMQALPAGAMLAVQLSEAELRPRLTDELSMAAVNGPASCVVSGTTEMVSAFADVLSEQGIRHTRLHTSHAFHSSMMEPILDEFAALVQRCNPQPPSVPFVSESHGRMDQRIRHDRSRVTGVVTCVRPCGSAQGVKTILREPDRVFSRLDQAARWHSGSFAVQAGSNARLTPSPARQTNRSRVVAERGGPFVDCRN